MIIIFLSHSLAPSALAKVVKVCGSRLGSLTHYLKNNEMIKEIGVKKLVPSVSLFVLIFALYVSNNISVQVGGLIPEKKVSNLD